MKLLVVVPCYYPATRYGGPIKSIHEMCAMLVRLGVEVTVYTTTADGAADLAVPHGVAVSVDGVRVFYFPLGRPGSYFRSPALRGALKRGVKEFDVVYIAWIYAYTTAAAAAECKRQGKPYVLSPRGMLDRKAISLKGTLKKWLYLALIGRRNLGGAAALHFTSLEEKRQAAFVKSDMKSFIVPNGIDISQYEMPRKGDELCSVGNLPSDRRLVLFLGRLNYIKGLDLLTKAWPLVVREVPSAHLVLAGANDDGLYQQMFGILEKQGLAHSITYSGLVEGHDKAALLWRAELLVSPSYLESFGMAIVEAMACKRPVVITDRVNICREIAESGAGLVTRCESAEIANAIVRILADDKRAARMGVAGRELVEKKFSLHSAAAALRDALQDVASARAA